IGMVAVAAFAPNTATLLPLGTSTAIGRRTSSAVSSGNRSTLFSPPAVDDRYVVAFDITSYCESLAKSAQTISHRVRRRCVKTSSRRDCRLLVACRKRTSRRADEKGDDLATTDESCHLIPPAGRANGGYFPHRSVSGFTSGTIAYDLARISGLPPVQRGI